MNIVDAFILGSVVSAGCHINDVMNHYLHLYNDLNVSAGCHINDVMNYGL